MQDERKEGIKVKIFLAAFLIFICIILVVYTYSFINLNNAYIKEESKTSNNCLNLNFDVLKITNSKNNIILTIRNNPLSTYEITQMNLKLENNTITKEIKIAPSKINEVLFENAPVDKDNIFIYPNNCEIFGKLVYLQKI